LIDYRAAAILRKDYTLAEDFNQLKLPLIIDAQRRQFGASSKKYADGYTQMDIFNLFYST
jgi:hypothetical protein